MTTVIVSDKNFDPTFKEPQRQMRRRSRFVGNGEENAAAKGSFPQENS